MANRSDLEQRRRQELERELESALQERDRALGLLSDARTEVNALRMLLQRQGAPEPVEVNSAGREALPLRYRLADAVNDAAKRVLGPAHAAVKGLAAGRRGGRS